MAYRRVRHRKHRRHHNPAHMFKRKGGHWKHFKGNPFKKNIVRGRRALKKGIAFGHYDRKGRFHRRKNESIAFGGPVKGIKGKFHPWRFSPDYRGPGKRSPMPAWAKKFGKRTGAKKRTTKRKSHRRKARR